MTPAAAGLLAKIPSPSDGSLKIGPLELRAYGLMIALGVLAAVWLFGRRLEERGIGNRDDAATLALWAVPAGVIGARLYHVITDWHRFDDRPGDIVKIWEGGLGIWGGIALGVAVGIYVARRKGMSMALVLTCATPTLPLAQAIGRWGNWFNQELFGRPTDLPWALEVSPEKAAEAGYPPGTTFHPTFLYESLWNLALCGGLLYIDRRWGNRLKPGRLFAVYVAGYTFARFFIERIRIDPANEVGGLRVNEWVSAIVFVAAVGYLVVDGFAKPATESVAADDGDDAEVEEAEAEEGQGGDAEPEAAEGDEEAAEPDEVDPESEEARDEVDPAPDGLEPDEVSADVKAERPLSE